MSDIETFWEIAGDCAGISIGDITEADVRAQAGDLPAEVVAAALRGLAELQAEAVAAARAAQEND